MCIHTYKYTYRLNKPLLRQTHTHQHNAECVRWRDALEVNRCMRRLLTWRMGPWWRVSRD